MHTDTIGWTVRDTIRIRDDGEHELSEPRTPTEHELRDLRDGYTRVAHWRGDLFCEPSHALTESLERQLAVAEAEAAELRRTLNDLEARGVIPPPDWPRGC